MDLGVVVDCPLGWLVLWVNLRLWFFCCDFQAVGADYGKVGGIADFGILRWKLCHF